MLDDMIRLIDFLKDNFNHWIKYVPNKNGQIVRLDRAVDLTQILKDIESL